MKYKYIVLDFGNVMVTPTTGDWNMTPKFLELVDVQQFQMEDFKKARRKYKYILSEKIMDLDEEYNMFFRFYDHVLKEIYSNYHKRLAEEIAYNRTYEYDKYQLCDNLIAELENLKKNYTLIMLSDNWPCAIPFMKEMKIYDYFAKIYVSSTYGVEKKDGTFFDYLIQDFQIKPGEALFIDDIEENLDIAKEKGFDVLLMDREMKTTHSKYRVIHDLFQIEEVFHD